MIGKPDCPICQEWEAERASSTSVFEEINTLVGYYAHVGEAHEMPELTTGLRDQTPEEEAQA